MYPASHKTVLVLDHTPYFGVSSECCVELDVGRGRGSGSGGAPPPPSPRPHVVSKSLWTCSVEAALEYCRIVWDLFPQGKLIKLIVSDTIPRILNAWSPVQQNLTYVLNGMCLIGVPGATSASAGNSSSSLGPSVVPGLSAAIEAISDLSPQQQKQIHKEAHIHNRSRILCITSARDNTSICSLIDIVQTLLTQHNKNLQPQMIRIHHIHLVIINVYPMNIESQVSSQPLRDVCNTLSVEVHSVNAARLAARLLRLLMPHYNLASTTVTGIPMKEEQNASSSANYDVEILHSAAAHADLERTLSNLNDKARVDTDTDYDTVTLRWCTPRGTWGEWGACGPLHRVTPVDVASRPSACLVNFLLNGRTVMLEMPRKSGQKVMSHILAAHGGEIFIYSLSGARSALEESPSVSELPGGRVTDYRIKDFGDVIKQNKLGPLRGPGALLKAKDRLARHTLWWPLTMSASMLFNLSVSIDPLPRLIVKEVLAEDDIIQCKQMIYSLAKHESRHEPISLLNMGHRSKGVRREDIWRQTWAELELFVLSHQSSSGHRAVLHCVRECRASSESGSTNGDSNMRASVIRATTDSPMSPPPAGMSVSMPTLHQPSPMHSSIYNTPRTVLDLFVSGDSNRNTTRRLDFAGRMTNPSGIAQLYPSLQNQWSSNLPESTPLEPGA